MVFRLSAAFTKKITAALIRGWRSLTLFVSNAVLIRGPLSYRGRSHTGAALIRGPLSYGGCAHSGAALIRGPLSFGDRAHSGVMYAQVRQIETTKKHVLSLGKASLN